MLVNCTPVKAAWNPVEPVENRWSGLVHLLNRAPDISLHGVQTMLSVSNADSCLERDQRNRNMVAGDLEGFLSGGTVNAGRVHQNAYAALQQLLVLQMDVHHQVAIHISQSRERAG